MNKELYCALCRMRIKYAATLVINAAEARFAYKNPNHDKISYQMSYWDKVRRYWSNKLIEYTDK